MESSFRSDTDPQQGSAHDSPQDASTAASVPVPPAPSTSPDDEKYARPGWSWGGFMFNFLFAIAIRRYLYLLWLLALVIPIVNFFVILGLMIYFGLKGRAMAAESKTFSNRDQYIGFMKGIDHAGRILFFFYAVIFTLILVGVMAAVGGIFLS